jgi:hypothetical protein
MPHISLKNVVIHKSVWGAGFDCPQNPDGPDGYKFARANLIIYNNVILSMKQFAPVISFYLDDNLVKKFWGPFGGTGGLEVRLRDFGSKGGRLRNFLLGWMNTVHLCDYDVVYHVEDEYDKDSGINLHIGVKNFEIGLVDVSKDGDMLKFNFDREARKFEYSIVSYIEKLREILKRRSFVQYMMTDRRSSLRFYMPALEARIIRFTLRIEEITDKLDKPRCRNQKKLKDIRAAYKIRLDEYNQVKKYSKNFALTRDTFLKPDFRNPNDLSGSDIYGDSDDHWISQ